MQNNIDWSKLVTKAMKVEAEAARALAAVVTETDKRRAIADKAIAPLQDAIEIGDASTEEKASLLLWRKYRVALNRINLQNGFPGAVEWPVAPE